MANHEHLPSTTTPTITLICPACLQPIHPGGTATTRPDGATIHRTCQTPIDIPTTPPRVDVKMNNGLLFATIDEHLFVAAETPVALAAAVAAALDETRSGFTDPTVVAATLTVAEQLDARRRHPSSRDAA